MIRTPFGRQYIEFFRWPQQHVDSFALSPFVNPELDHPARRVGVKALA